MRLAGGVAWLQLMRASSGRLEELLPSVMTTLSDRQALQAVKTHALKTVRHFPPPRSVAAAGPSYTPPL